MFGSAVDALTWEAADRASRQRLIEKRFGEVDEAQVLARLDVVDQLISGEPPAVWQAAQRIIVGGRPVDPAIDELTMVFVQSVADSVRDGGLR